MDPGSIPGSSTDPHLLPTITWSRFFPVFGQG